MMMDYTRFLPMTKEEMEARDWHYLDILIISGDAYVDHPSFGSAIIGRYLESLGFRVGIVAQPDWRKNEDFTKLGKPRIGIFITAGNLDSMVNHYTAAKKPRDKDAYSPSGKSGLRPNRATMVYAHKAREVFKGKPIIIGGIEASLRRFAHYDYWDDEVRRSILIDSRADLLVYGMGEKQVEEIANFLKSNPKAGIPKHIKGTVYLTSEPPEGAIELPSYEECKKNKEAFAKAFMIQYDEQDPIRGKTLFQKHGDKYLVQNTPMLPLNQGELDKVYNLPFQRTWHPVYDAEGGIPALAEVEFSIAANRGCFGGCSFCALTFHQGRIVQSRSKASIMNEAQQMAWNPGFKGYIHDVGGPTANFRKPSCKKQLKLGTCKHRQCLYPEPCPNLETDHKEYLEILRDLRALPHVKKVFIRSGIRYDYLQTDKSSNFLDELCQHHISGQLKIAPEHISDKVLKRMGKPGKGIFNSFVERYHKTNKRLKKQQFLVPYFMSSHPGSTLEEAIELAEYLRDTGIYPEQVQDFIPTPGSLSTCIFYTGLDPRTMEKVYVPRSPREKAMQRALLQYKNPNNYDLVYSALRKVGRDDLIGYGPKALIRPRKQRQSLPKGTASSRKPVSNPKRARSKKKEDR